MAGSDTAAGSHDVVHIERIGGHRELTVGRAPFTSWPIRIHLDAKPAGILQVDSFADKVVGHSGVHANRREMGDQSAK